MTIYLLNIFLLFLEAIIIAKNKKWRRGKAVFVFLASLQWILISGLRHITVGGRDVYYSYNFSFARSINTSWGDALDRFINILFYGAEGKDPGYLFVEKAIGIFTDNYQVFLFVIALLFIVPFGVFIYRNSKDVLMSFLIYSTLFYSFFSLTGFRQAIATSLVVLIGYELIKKKKLIWFVVVSLVAFTIHKSSIVFFPFYFMADKKITTKYLIFMGGLGLIILMAGKALYAPLAIWLEYDNMLDNDIGGTGTFTLMLSMVAIAGVIQHKPMQKNNPQSAHFINASILAMLLGLLTLQSQSFMRVQQYFSLFIVLLVPEFIRTFLPKEQVLIYMISVGTLLMLFIRNNPSYIFFWQGG